MRVVLAGIAIILVGLMTACSTTHHIRISTVTQFEKELKSESNIVSSFDCSFTRPDLTCRLRLKEVPTPEELTSLVSQVQTFSTVENLDKIAKAAHWPDHVWRMLFAIYIMNDQIPQHVYTADYDVPIEGSRDGSVKVDGYKTWRKEY